MRIAALVLLGELLVSDALCAQLRVPSEAGTTYSLGQPRTWKATAGVAAGWLSHTGNAQAVAEARIGVFRDLLNPVIGIAGFHVEAYLGSRATELDGGLRARFVSPFARVGIGADYNAKKGRTHLILSAFNSGRRGGLFHDGTALRLDFLPGHDRTLTLGIEKPIARRIPMGRTRPARDHVRLPIGKGPSTMPPRLPVEIDAALATARDAADRIRRLTIPFLDHDGPNRRAAEDATVAQLRNLRETLLARADDGAGARGGEDEVRRFHAAIERAFSVDGYANAATGGEPTALGRTLAAQARTILLAEILLPYNRLLGQRKERDSILGLGLRAAATFQRGLDTSGVASPGVTVAIRSVFAALIDIIEANRRAARNEWRDSRFVWLPLQYALRPEDHDTQLELDALIERATGADFTEGNFVSYIINEQFQYQLSRTISEAEEYHVLWTHDFRGIDGGGKPDEMSFRHVLRSYFAAMTKRVRAYDSTGTFPVYLIFIDQWFYEVNKGRLWLSLLEHPVDGTADLPDGFKAWEDSLAAAQSELRRAIEGSTRLQAQRKQYGDAWLKTLVRVHVNVTNPSDLSFWSWGVARFVSLPDNIMRDHRKFAFYDLTEEDPYRGEAIYTGAGVGEHYANLSWEDRALLVRGPAALGLKHAARELLLNHGVPPDRIPHPLQPRQKAADYATRVSTAVQGSQRPLRALEVHNGSGFADKKINVAKAILYSLMPPGSVIKIPDSLWNDAFWGSALLGASLRGVRVLIIAPSYANAPARAFGSLARSNELLWRLVAASHELQPAIAASGGLLKVGLYASPFAVTDIPAKVDAVRTTLAREEWLRKLFNFAPAVYADLDELATTLRALSMAPDDEPEFEYDPRPSLHLKANFFASREAWTLMSRPEWIEMTWEFVQQRIAQVQTRTAAVRSFATFPDAMIDVGGGVVQNWYESLDQPTKDRVVFFTMMGSQNQNTRSMVVDGEVAFVVSAWPSVIPYLDFISLAGQCRWLTDPAEVDELLPPQSEFKRGLARRFKLQF